MDGEQQQLIDGVFDAFAWRQRPERIFVHDYVVDGVRVGQDWESVAYEQHLAGIAPRDLTFAALDAYDGDRNVLFSFATPEGARYFVPSIVALCIEDWDRADFLRDILIWQFRAFPYATAAGALPSWPAAFQACPASELRQAQVSAWFLEAHPSCNKLMSGMTPREREVVAEYFDFEARHCVRSFGTSGLIERRAASAFLRGRPYARRLGARNEEENQALLDAFAVLKRRLPEAFSGARAQAAEAKLQRDLANWDQSAVPGGP